MACRTIVLDDGGIMWLCGQSLVGHPVCRICGHMATKLCDYPVGGDKTCDSALCDHHSIKLKGDIDYCPEHSSHYGEVIRLQRFQNGDGI